MAKKILKLSQTARDARIAYSYFNIYSNLGSIKTIIASSKLTPICPVEKYLNIFKMLSGMGSVTFDCLTLLSRNGVINPKNEKCYDKTMSYFWTMNIFFGAGLSYYKLKQLKKGGKGKNDEKTKLQKKIYVIDIVSNLSDIFAAFGGTELLPKYFGWNFSKPVKGLGGTVAATTSIINFRLNKKL